MEKERSTRAIALLALVVAVLGVSLGFSTLSVPLLIKPSANVTTNPDVFNIRFSTVSSELKFGSITPTKKGTGSAAFEGHEAVIAGNKTITGVGGTFTNPGQSFEYTFYVVNFGKLDGHLDAIKFKNAAGQATPIACTAKEGTQEDLVEKACKGIKITVDVNGTPYTTSKSSIQGQILNSNEFETVKVTVEYEQNADVADGDFDVAFGDIELTYVTES